MDLLAGKVVIVTGSTRGIGLAIAQAFCKQGAHVFINGRNSQDVTKIVTSLTDLDLLASPFICDVGNPIEVKAAFQSFLKTSKSLDILVNNAGILVGSLLSMVSFSDLEESFRINTFSNVYLSQYASRIMSRRKSGSIINLTSIMGLNGNAGLSVYSGSKAAVIGITKSLSKELAPSNIRVNAIAPGFIDTEMARSIPSSVFDERIDSIKMGRIGSPEEVANVALFLASDLSSYVTGQVIGVDGGMLI